MRTMQNRLAGMRNGSKTGMIRMRNRLAGMRKASKKGIMDQKTSGNVGKIYLLDHILHVKR